MIISDLTYMESVNEEIVGGIGFATSLANATADAFGVTTNSTTTTTANADSEGGVFVPVLPVVYFQTYAGAASASTASAAS